MVLLGDEAKVEARFGPFTDRANRCKIGARFVRNVPYAQKSFWMHLMVLLGDEAQEQARFGLFRDRANLDVR